MVWFGVACLAFDTVVVLPLLVSAVLGLACLFFLFIVILCCGLSLFCCCCWRSACSVFIDFLGWF